MECKKMSLHDTVAVAVTCFEKTNCPKGSISGYGSCSELEDREIIVPFESSLEEHVAYLNSAEKPRDCKLGFRRYRVPKLTENK